MNFPLCDSLIKYVPCLPLMMTRMKACLIRRSRTSSGSLSDPETSTLLPVSWRHNKTTHILLKLSTLFGCHNATRSISNTEDLKGYNALYMFFIWLCINHFRVFGGKPLNMLNQAGCYIYAINICVRIGTIRNMLIQIHAYANFFKIHFLPNITLVR